MMFGGVIYFSHIEFLLLTIAVLQPSRTGSSHCPIFLLAKGYLSYRIHSVFSVFQVKILVEICSGPTAGAIPEFMQITFLLYFLTDAHKLR